jgi:uncharacterized membrane-anchored protein
VTRPLGASIADWWSKPATHGGLGYGTGAVASFLVVMSATVLTYVAGRPYIVVRRREYQASHPRNR